MSFAQIIYLEISLKDNSIHTLEICATDIDLETNLFNFSEHCEICSDDFLFDLCENECEKLSEMFPSKIIFENGRWIFVSNFIKKKCLRFLKKRQIKLKDIFDIVEIINFI